MKYPVGQRVIALFGSTSAEGTVVRLKPNGVRTYLVRLDEITDREYVMQEDELTTIEELFG